MNAPDDATCSAMVNRGDWMPRERCGRPTKRDGLCGIHATARDKRQARSDKYHQQAAMAASYRGELQDLLGIKVFISTERDRYTVQVDPEVLLDALTKKGIVR